ncbi:unnamed protein product [Adineta steineri]|uniref:Uncharacterized protein n=1 Tax=Adineta steineri TaxID=433720 RepID=A0A819T354_9BILA|nr:unnamed protein product [Adineta steineri]
MSCPHHEFFDLYCCLSDEFLISNPQLQTSSYYKQKIYRNTNALESSLLSSRRSKYKSKHLLRPYKLLKDDIHTFEKTMKNKIMSIESSDHEVEFYMEKKPTVTVKHHQHTSQMADGDKKNTFHQYQQQRFTDSQEHSIDMIHKDIIRPIPRKPLLVNDSLKRSFITRSTLPLNRTSTWRKLQANITASQFDHIQQFQQEQYSRSSVPCPIMLSPLNKLSEITKLMSNTSDTSISSTSLLIDSSANLSDTNSLVMNSRKTIQPSKISSIENIITENKINHSSHILIENSINISLQNSSNESPIHKNEDIEEFKPVTETISPIQVPSILLNDILLSSFMPNIDNNKTSFILVGDTADLIEHLVIDQIPTTSSIESKCISEENDQLKKVPLLSESIEELCFLIRKLLQYELAEQNITSLQVTITNQLAILLTYLASSNNEKIISELLKKNTVEKMTSINETDFTLQQPIVLSTGTQTNMQSETMLESSKIKQKTTIDTSSHTDLISTSVTLNLSGHRLNHTLSDTFIYHIHHHQQYSPSNHKLISYSETTIHSLMHRFHQQCSTKKEETKRLLKCIGQKFQHYIELESSNTCLEASTEFTPDFLLTTINTLKYDENDQTEQFGIDIDKQDYQTDTLTFNSSEKDNHDQYPFTLIRTYQSINKSQIEEDNSLFLNNSTSVSCDDDFISPVINRLNNKTYCCQLLEPLRNLNQWQIPILPKESNSFDLIYEKQMAKINCKHLRTRSNLNNRINISGKRVLVKSNSLSLSIQGQEQLKKSSILNYNNNYHEYSKSSTSNDSLYTLDSDTLDKNSPNLYRRSSDNIQLLTNFSKSDEFNIHLSHPNIYKKYNKSIETTCLPTTVSSDLSEINDKLNSNIILAENLLDMLDSLNNPAKNSLTINSDVLHMYIRQFLIQFDASIRLARNKRRKRKKVIH